MTQSWVINHCIIISICMILFSFVIYSYGEFSLKKREGRDV
ncbi:MAG: hypothetical protein ACRC9L_06470 [Brevinema sp.]